MNIFNIIEGNFFRISGSRCGIGCRLRNSDTEIRIIENNSDIPTDTLVSILNGRRISDNLFSDLRMERNENLDVFIRGRHLREIETSVLCVVRHIQDMPMPVEISRYLADTMIFILSEGRLPSHVSQDRLNAELNSVRNPEAETLSTINECKKKNTIMDVDCLIDANEFVDKISKCCNNNSAKIIVRHGDDELKIVDTCIEKGFLYIDVVNPKKLKDILEKH